jgi:hypothetical protein
MKYIYPHPKNDTFSEFRYLANGGWPGKENTDAESGGPGTVYPKNPSKYT